MSASCKPGRIEPVGVDCRRSSTSDVRERGTTSVDSLTTRRGGRDPDMCDVRRRVDGARSCMKLGLFNQPAKCSRKEWSRSGQ